MSDCIVEAVLEEKKEKKARKERKEGTVPRWWSSLQVPHSQNFWWVGQGFRAAKHCSARHLFFFCAQITPNFLCACFLPRPTASNRPRSQNHYSGANHHGASSSFPSSSVLNSPVTKSQTVAENFKMPPKKVAAPKENISLGPSARDGMWNWTSICGGEKNTGLFALWIIFWWLLRMRGSYLEIYTFAKDMT